MKDVFYKLSSVDRAKLLMLRTIYKFKFSSALILVVDAWKWMAVIYMFKQAGLLL